MTLTAVDEVWGNVSSLQAAAGQCRRQAYNSWIGRLWNSQGGNRRWNLWIPSIARIFSSVFRNLRNNASAEAICVKLLWCTCSVAIANLSYFMLWKVFVCLIVIWTGCFMQCAAWRAPHEASCLHYLLPDKRDSSVTDRLRHAKTFHSIQTRTNKFRNSFLPFCLQHFD